MHIRLYMLKLKTLFKICPRLAMFECENESKCLINMLNHDGFDQC